MICCRGTIYEYSCQGLGSLGKPRLLLINLLLPLAASFALSLAVSLTLSAVYRWAVTVGRVLKKAHIHSLAEAPFIPMVGFLKGVA